jgi:hypothetical protein
MQYIALIYDVEDRPESPSEFETMMNGYFAFNAHTKAEGSFVGGDALQPTSTATTVRVRDGEVLLTDGPFAETREALGGYYLLECRDFDHAVELASRIPGAATGCVEVRPVMVIPGDE